MFKKTKLKKSSFTNCVIAQIKTKNKGVITWYLDIQTAVDYNIGLLVQKSTKGLPKINYCQPKKHFTQGFFEQIAMPK